MAIAKNDVIECLEINGQLFLIGEFNGYINFST